MLEVEKQKGIIPYFVLRRYLFTSFCDKKAGVSITTSIIICNVTMAIHKDFFLTKSAIIMLTAYENHQHQRQRLDTLHTLRSKLMPFFTPQ